MVRLIFHHTLDHNAAMFFLKSPADLKVCVSQVAIGLSDVGSGFGELGGRNSS